MIHYIHGNVDDTITLSQLLKCSVNRNKVAVREGGGFLSKINRNEVLPLTIPKTECVIPICK